MTSCQGAGGTGQKLTYAQLKGLWISNGGPAAVADIAAAVGIAESDGCTTALNPDDNNGTQSSYGLWQISNGTHQPPAADWSDPNVNAKLAVAKYRGAGNSFAPWGTYDSGAYKADLAPGTTPDMSVPGGSTAALASASGDATCAASWPSQSLIVTTVGGGCIIHKKTVRHIMGGVLMGAGALLILPGVAVLVAFAFRRSGALTAAGNVAAVIPGGQPAAAGLHMAGQRVNRTGAQAAAQRAAKKQRP